MTVASSAAGEQHSVAQLSTRRERWRPASRVQRRPALEARAAVRHWRRERRAHNGGVGVVDVCGRRGARRRRARNRPQDTSGELSARSARATRARSRRTRAHCTRGGDRAIPPADATGTRISPYKNSTVRVSCCSLGHNITFFTVE